MKKIYGILVCSILLLSLTGCGSTNTESEQYNNENAAKTDKNESTTSLNNSDIENVIDGWIKAIEVDYNAKEAYQYIDFVGVAVWQYLRHGSGELKENDVPEFLELYNKYNNDTTLKNKVNDYVKENITDDFYNTLNETLANSKTTFTKYEIKNIQEVSPNIYNVYVYYEVMINNQKSSYNIEHTLIKKENGYYFINAGALYETDLLDLWSVIK